MHQQVAVSERQSFLAGFHIHKSDNPITPLAKDTTKRYNKYFTEKMMLDISPSD